MENEPNYEISKEILELLKSDQLMLKPSWNTSKFRKQIESQYNTEIVEITTLSDNCFDRQTFLALEWKNGEYSIRKYYRFLNLYNGKMQNFGQGSGEYLFHGIKNNKKEGYNKALETFNLRVSEL